MGEFSDISRHLSMLSPQQSLPTRVDMPPPFEDQLEQAHVRLLRFLFSPLADYMQLAELHTDTGRHLRPLLPPGGGCSGH
eukprot:5225500-Amphidinium_carterae.1